MECCSNNLKVFVDKYKCPNEYARTLEYMAKETLINLLFKTQYRVSEKQKEYAYEKYNFWILRCMIEIHEREGANGVTGYRENGLQITFDSSQLSNGLLREIVPLARSI